MTAAILDGRPVASQVKSEVTLRVAALRALGVKPGLATVVVGDDPASHLYVRHKRRDAEEVGIRSIHHELPADTGRVHLEAVIDELNNDPGVHGVLVQLPLPEGLDSDTITERVDPAKDVDGLHPYNLGLLVLGRPGLRPCTPSGILRLLEHHGLTTSGRRAVIVGRSFLVGRPLALMLSARGADATVAIAHTRTPDLGALTREADLLVSAVGVPGLITTDLVKPGAVVVDVGTTRTEDGLRGDVDFEAVVDVAGAITPVPGGVGPMTRAMLLVNTVTAAEQDQFWRH